MNSNAITGMPAENLVDKLLSKEILRAISEILEPVGFRGWIGEWLTLLLDKAVIVY